MQKIILSFFLSLSLSLAYAQDIQFINTHAQAAFWNPAYWGESTLKASVVYRDQWQSVLGANAAYKTMLASVEGRQTVGGQCRDNFGFGLNLIMDKAGQSNLSHLQADLGVSFTKKLSNRHRGRGADNFLRGGTTLSYGQRSTDGTALSFTSQYATDGRLDPSVGPPSAGLVRWQHNYVDASLGLAFVSTIDKNQFWSVGAAIQHLLEPNLSLTPNSTTLLPRRYILQINGAIPLSKNRYSDQNTALRFQLWASKQGQFMSLVGGTTAWFGFDKEKAFGIGASLRLAQRLQEGLLADAFIPTVRFQWAQVEFSLSHDFNISALNQASVVRYNAAPELALIYRFEQPQGKNCVSCYSQF